METGDVHSADMVVDDHETTTYRIKYMNTKESVELVNYETITTY